MYRLHIDIPLPLSEEAAAALSRAVVEAFVRESSALLRDAEVAEVNYRLGHDDDRQRSNYLEKTPSGHVVNRKSRIPLQKESSE